MRKFGLMFHALRSARRNLPPARAACTWRRPRHRRGSGDLHFANRTAYDSVILDREGWGIDPGRYAAALNVYSLFTLAIAARVKPDLADVFGVPMD